MTTRSTSGTARSVPAAAADAPAVAAAPGTWTSRERALLQAALMGPGLAARLDAEVPAETFRSPSLARIARAVVETAREGTADPAACAASLGDEVLADEVAALAASGAAFRPEATLRQFEDCVRWLAYETRRSAMRIRVARSLTAGVADSVGDPVEEFGRLQREREKDPGTTKR